MPSLKSKTRRFAQPLQPRRLDLIPVLLTLLALGAILVGARSELVTLRPTYDGPILGVQTGASGVNHTEWFLTQVAGLGVAGAVAAIWWRRTALVIQIIGGGVLFFAGRAAYYQYESFDLYTAVPLFNGTSGPVILGPAIGWFVLGGVLFVAAGIAGYQPDRRAQPDS